MFKHLTLRDRVQLQYYIEFKQHISLSEAATLLVVNPSSIYREPKNHRFPTQRRLPMFSNKSNCKNDHCPFTDRFPYICNPCERVNTCSKSRYKYDAYAAHEISRKKLKEARSNPSLTEKQIHLLDKKISQRVINKQSLYHILQSDPSILISESTIRRYIDKQLLTCRNIDLPRTVRFRVSKPIPRRKAVPIEFLNKRTYQGYLEFIEKPRCTTLQVDTVVGLTSDKKFILTLFEPITRFQWGYILPRVVTR